MGLIPAALLQLPQLLRTALDCLAPDAAARHTDSAGHLRQYLFVLTRGDSSKQSARHPLGGGPVILKSFISRYGNVTLLFVTQPGTFHFDLPVGETYPSGLRSMPADFTAEFAWCTGPGQFLGA